MGFKDYDNILTIIATSDVHGHVFPTDYRSRDSVAGYGLSRVSTAVNEYREKGNVLLVDNGDAFQGSPLSVFGHRYPETYDNPVATAFNVMEYDYINLGNHDFNYGKDALNKFIDENKATVITSNITENSEFLGSTQIIDIHNKKIALIGVVTQYIYNWEKEEHIKDTIFLNAYEKMKEEVERVRDNVDFVVGMYHGGLERDPITNEPTEVLTGENLGSRMTTIEGLDVLITGHQHRSLVYTINDVVVTQTADKASQFAVIKIDCESGEIIAEIKQSSEYVPDQSMLNELKKIQEDTQNWLDTQVGSFQENRYEIKDGFDARIHKHPFVSFVNQVQKEETGSMLSATALYNIANGLEKEVSVRNLVNAFFYPNTIVLKEMTGKDIRLMLEHTAKYFALNEDGEIVVAHDYLVPKPQHYNYDMIDGLDYELKISNDIGERVQSLKYKGKPVDDTDIFTIAVSNYRSAGGGNYDMIKESKTLEDNNKDLLTVMIDYFEKNSPVVVEHKHNIKVCK